MLTVNPYPYQDKAIDQALDRGNLLIAYGMGLGKTLVQLAVCEELLGDDEVDLCALVVPSSLKWQWAQAIVWATDVQREEKILNPRTKKQRIVVPAPHHCVVIDGTREKREQQYAYIKRKRPDYVILGYDNVVNDWRRVKMMKPGLISLDEATAIKSFNAERSLMVKQWWAEYRYALTGTPIDNRPEELYSIMEWVDPDELGSPRTYDKTYIVRGDYGKVVRYRNLDALHKKIQSFVARKTRFDPEVAPFMPKDYSKDLYVQLTGKAKTLYKEIARELLEMLEDMTSYGSFDVGAYYSGESQGGGSPEQGAAMARFGVLAMLCDHPMLVLESAHKFRDWMKNADLDNPGVSHGSQYAYDLLMEGRLDWINKKTVSPKFEQVIEEIENILDEREANKVIVFSFAKGILKLLQERLGHNRSVIFSGDQSTSEKESAKQRFKTDPKIRLFLSSDAGGMGVDLPEANYLINFNHPWSAGKADQRNSRHIRAGSKWDEVWVLNFIVEDSVEDWKYQILDIKRKVGSAILDGAPTKRGVVSFDVSSLFKYLQSSPL